MRLVVDVSSILWTALRGGFDTEGFDVIKADGKKQHVNTAGYGYEKAVPVVIEALDSLKLSPIDMTLVVEGLSSKSPRLNIFNGYKAGSGDKANEEYLEFAKLRDMFCDAFMRVGALKLVQDYAEADDVIGWLSVNTEEPMFILTNDNDLSVLNHTNTYGAEVIVSVGGVIGQNKYGDFPFRFVTLYKALVGDSSDKITGLPGFGPKTWEQLVSRFGVAGMELLVDIIRRNAFDELYEDSRKDKFVAKLYEGSAAIVQSYKLATIYPEWVDTMNNPLQWFPGMAHGEVTDKRLKKWAARRSLVTASNFPQFKDWALPRIKQRPFMALDIETSTPSESDSWLAGMGDPDGVDVIGSELSGMSLTFGNNMQFTVYISVDHVDTDNVKSEDLRDWLAEVCAETGVLLVIHNTMFEGPVLHNAWGEAWKDNGYSGFLPNWTDTRFWASYVDENDKLGLKHLAKKWLGYSQVDYKTTTYIQSMPGTDSRGEFKGLVKVVDTPAVYRPAYATELADDFTITTVCETDEVSHMEELRQCKMRELTAQHVFDYACDDTVVTASLYSFFRQFTQLEHTSKVLESVEIDASYLHAHAFTEGCKVDAAKLAELVEEDGIVRASAQQVLDAYLVAKGWEGTVLPVFSAPFAAADIKLAHLIITGEPLETAVRTPSKLLALIQDETCYAAIEQAVTGDFEFLNKVVAARFNGRPEINLGSPKQMQRLMYETMGLPVKVYNAPTETMRKAGLKVGTPKTDNMAIAYALLDCDEALKPVLEALRQIKMVNTRFSLFYDPLPGFVHWKTGKVHSSHNQCATNTRRASSSKPNTQQLSKNEKVEGYSPRVRELYVPHKRNAVIVSLDFNSQELVLMAHWSQDPGMLSCFVGDKLTDMHSMTGVGIHNRMHGTEYSYDVFVDILKGEPTAEQKKAKRSRASGKGTNFGGQYRIAAKKLSLMLFVPEDEAQAMIDAKAEAFPVAEAWSLNEMEAVKSTGKVHTVLGAVRHLREQIMSSDRVVASKAPRQTLSYRIQGSSAEQTKLAEGRMWKEKLHEKYDAVYFAAIHDETVWSVGLDDLIEFIPDCYAQMTKAYGNMAIPVRSSVSIGWNFGEQVELEGDFSKENIYKALGLQLEVTQ